MPRLPAARQRGTRGSVLEELVQCGSWEEFRGPTGARLWRIPGAGGRTYTTCRASCTCPADSFGHGAPCKHREALAFYLLIEAAILRRTRQPPEESPDRVD